MQLYYLDTGLTFCKVSSEKGRKKTPEMDVIQACNIDYEPIAVRPEEEKHICRVVLIEPV